VQVRAVGAPLLRERVAPGQREPDRAKHKETAPGEGSPLRPIVFRTECIVGRAPLIRRFAPASPGGRRTTSLRRLLTEVSLHGFNRIPYLFDRSSQSVFRNTKAFAPVFQFVLFVDADTTSILRSLFRWIVGHDIHTSILKFQPKRTLKDLKRSVGRRTQRPIGVGPTSESDWTDYANISSALMFLNVVFIFDESLR
jgi:hypothetical protein